MTVDRRAFLRRSGAALAGLGPAVRGSVAAVRGSEAAVASARGGAYANPVFERVFPDPTVVRAPDGTYFAYATYHDWGSSAPRGHAPDGDGAAWDGERPVVPVLRSRTLVDWTFVGAAFERKPDWRDAVGVWAPDAARHRGRYLLYYSLSSWGDPNPGIGVAVADSPTGPFEDRGKLLGSDGIGVPNSIDPCFVADGGTPFLFWGSHRGIYGVELSPDGQTVAGEQFQVAGGGVEAPDAIERDGRYYLFVSAGTCCAGAESTYRVLVGRAPELRGPYRDRNGDFLTASTGTTVLRGSEQFAGPGHCAVATDDGGTDWLVYHAYERGVPWVGATPRRVLMVDRLRWRDGWPTVPGTVPSTAAEKPTVTGVNRPNDRET